MDLEEQIEARDLICKALSVLTERQRDIFVDRALHGLTFKQLGTQYGGVTGQRAKQIHDKALRLMRHRLKFHGERITPERPQVWEAWEPVLDAWQPPRQAPPPRPLPRLGRRKTVYGIYNLCCFPPSQLESLWETPVDSHPDLQADLQRTKSTGQSRLVPQA